MTLISPSKPEVPTWDLTRLYTSHTDTQIDVDLINALEVAKALSAKFKGRIATLEPAALLELLQASEAVGRQATRPSWYANLRFAAQTDDANAKALVDRTRSAATGVFNEITFIRLELRAVSDEVFSHWLAAPELGAYQHFLRLTRQLAPHTLSEAEERLMTSKALTGRSAWGQLFTETVGRIRIPLTVNGETREYTTDETRALRTHPDRSVRRQATEGLFSAFAEREHVLTYIFNTLYQDWKLDTDLRHYPSPIAPTALENEVSPETIEVLMRTTEANADIIQAYYREKARVIGVDDFSSFDLMAPLEQTEGRYSFEAARDLVLEAVGKFSPTLADLCQKFFDERRIDAQPRPGKAGGAFCSSVHPAEPVFILQNFNHRLDDAFTLAHELGHGVHAELSRAQNPTNYRPHMPLAETASVFLEMLLFDHLLETADTHTRRSLLANLIEDASSTIFRQVQITRWEQLAHLERHQGIVTSERYGDLWMDTFKRTYGDAVAPLPGDRWGWIGIPHVVQYRFYCYSYAFGNLVVYALFDRYKTMQAQGQGEAFQTAYLEFLAAGSSSTPQELMQRLGVDLEDPNFWQGGFNRVRGFLEQFKAVSQS